MCDENTGWTVGRGQSRCQLSLTVVTSTEGQPAHTSLLFEYESMVDMVEQKSIRQKLETTIIAIIQKYQTYLNEMDMQPNQGGYGSTNYNGIRTSQHRSSGSDESLTRSASDLSQNNHKASAPGTPLPSHG